MSCQTSFRVLITIVFSSISMHVTVTTQQVDNEFICENVVTYFNDNEYSAEVEFNHVEMLKKCDPSYMDDESVKKKCNQWLAQEDTHQSIDVFQNLPVTSMKKNITYWNTYCALCNFEFEFVHWIPLSFDMKDMQCEHRASNFGFRFPSQNANWTSRNDSQICNRNATVYTALKNLKYGCQLDDGLIINGASYMIYDTLSKFCTKHSPMYCTPELAITKDLLCLYGSDIRTSCTKNVFLYEGLDFAYGDNGSIFVYNINGTSRFNSHEYSNKTGMNRIIYLCGQEEISFTTFSKFILILLVVSTGFLILCIVLNSNKESLRNLPNRSLYSYSIASVIYLLAIIDANYLFFTGSCFYMQILLNAAAMSAILWNCAVLFEYSRVTYYLMRNKKVTDGIQMQKYLVYCLLCWIFPAVLYSLMFSLTRIDGKPLSCPEIDDYSLVYCCYQLRSAEHWKFVDKILDIMNIVISIFVTFGFSAMAFAMVNLSKRDSVRSTYSRNYLIIYLKMMCAISSHFVFLLFAYLLRFAYGENCSVCEILYALYDMLDYAQGIFIYFAFYCKKGVFGRFLMYCKSKKAACSGAVEMAGKASQNN